MEPADEHHHRGSAYSLATTVEGVRRKNQLSGANVGTTFYLPLQFWFNRHTGLALPLIALQYHEVKINS